MAPGFRPAGDLKRSRLRVHTPHRRRRQRHNDK